MEAGELLAYLHNLEQRFNQRISDIMADLTNLNAAVAANTQAVTANSNAVQAANALLAQLHTAAETPAVQQGIDAATAALDQSNTALTTDTASLTAAIAANQPAG